MPAAIRGRPQIKHDENAGADHQAAGVLQTASRVVGGRQHRHLASMRGLLEAGLVQPETAMHQGLVHRDLPRLVDARRGIDQADGAGERGVAHASRIGAAVEILQLDRVPQRPRLVAQRQEHRASAGQDRLRTVLGIASLQPDGAALAVDRQFDQRGGFRRVRLIRLRPRSAES